ncbi:MAG: hypothetical protein E6J90_39695, partial [Deltaproteobacteria bacterium]
MTHSALDSRDPLLRLSDGARKTLRRWWLIAVCAIVGGGLSLAFAVTRPRSFQTWTTLVYQEPIQPQLLFPGREEVAQRNIGDRYRELLLSRRKLEQILGDPALDPYPGEADPERKVDRLQMAVRLESRGAGVLRIVFADSDPERARRVADKLTEMLQDTDEALRKRQTAKTVAFVTEQQSTARAELGRREAAYTKFLVEHPEFVPDASSPPRREASCPTRRASDVSHATADRRREPDPQGPARARRRPERARSPARHRHRPASIGDQCSAARHRRDTAAARRPGGTATRQRTRYRRDGGSRRAGDPARAGRGPDPRRAIQDRCAERCRHRSHGPARGSVQRAGARADRAAPAGAAAGRHRVPRPARRQPEAGRAGRTADGPRPGIHAGATDGPRQDHGPGRRYDPVADPRRAA